MLRWNEATELPNDENAVTDHFDGPSAATRLPETGDEDQVFGSIVSHRRLSIGHARAPEDARVDGIGVCLHNDRSGATGARVAP
jgi:hypothetical protein